MDALFELFLREKRYVKNVSEHTLEFYRYAYKALKGNLGPVALADLGKPHLINFVATMRERGLSANTSDAYIRGINPFLTWLFENGHTTQHLKIPRIKIEQRVMRSLTETQLRAIVSYKPQDDVERRVHSLVLLLLDTGLRIEEALTIERSKVDFDNLLISVIGKGNKERVVPFSYELRKVLYRELKKHKFELVFCNRYGGRLLYDNMRRDFNKLMTKLGIKTDSAFHSIRRTFATNYVKQGGNPLVLQRLLGHTTLAMTNKYVKLVTEDLSKEQHRTSILSRLR
jgi:integrase/recombinase XerD